MLRRYELTDDEWNRIVDLLPPENTGKQGRPRKDNRTIVNGMVWIARGGASTKIHAIVDSYGNPVRLMISEGQRNDITCAIPLLEQIDIEGSHVLADRGYDSSHLIDYIYDHGGEPTIPSRKGAKFERRCDWWLYKERHLVEKLFLKLKAYRRIATRYDKLACTYLGFLCITKCLALMKSLRNVPRDFSFNLISLAIHQVL